MNKAEREKYRIYAKIPVYRRRVQRSVAIIRQALETPGIWAVALSGGKDSTCVLQLCVDAGWRGPCFHFYYAETPPENTALCVALADRYGLELQTVKLPGAFDVYEQAGRFFTVPETEEEKRATRAMLKGYKAGADQFASKMQHTGQFWGLRSQESKYRAITVAKKGTIYRTQDRTTITCLPLAQWSAMDVWAYLLQHDLPWLSIYDAAEDRERARSEITWLASEALWRYGQGKLLREHDPKLFHALCEKYPELARYG